MPNNYDGSGNTVYQNYVLQNELKDQLTTRMDLLRFCTVDDSLVAAAGDQVHINVYEGAGAAEAVAEGAGNTSDLTIGYTPKSFTVGTVQARFPYTDEQQMRDPLAIQNGIGYLSTVLVNKISADVVAQFASSTNAVYTGAANTAPTFDNFVDAVALMTLKDDASGSEQAGSELFALLNRNEVALLRKSLKDDLKYVEAYIRTGYVGSVAGVNIYVNDAIPNATIILGTAEAVKYFRKKNPETETDRNPNTRTNYLYGRQVGVAALVDTTKAAKIMRAAAPAG